MRTIQQRLTYAVLVFAGLSLVACQKGGSLNLEPGAIKVLSQGSPFVQVNQGGQALVVEQGKTAQTGVHGWVTIQAVQSQNLSSSGKVNAVLNRSQAFE